MYAFIKGTVVALGENNIVLENNGIGYSINVSNITLASFTVGEIATLKTYLYVKEDVFMLFGFKTSEEKHFFEKLLTVSGIGAKSAMQILSGYPLTELISYIASENVGMLTKIKGLGKKTAERIVLELKEQFKNCFEPSANNQCVALSSDAEDAVIALMSLGLTKQDALEAVKEASKEVNGLENIIAYALKRI